jgi:hypothetical protein
LAVELQTAFIIIMSFAVTGAEEQEVLGTSTMFGK